MKVRNCWELPAVFVGKDSRAINTATRVTSTSRVAIATIGFTNYSDIA